MDPKSFLSDAPGSLHFDPGGFWTYHPYPLPPLFRWTDPLVSALSTADHSLGRLAARLERSPGSIFPITARMEAAASCRMAGIRVDLAAVFEAQAGYLETTQRKNGEDQAAAYALALLGACERQPEERLRLRELERIHGDMLPGIEEPPRQAGAFRSGQTWIGPPGSTPTDSPFVPPPPDVMETALESLEDYINRPGRLPALVRLALIHYQFDVIHPFIEGNGRFVRLLNSLLLCRFGLLPGPGAVLTRHFERHAPDYFRHLSMVRRENAFGEWIRFYLEAVTAACEHAGQLLTAYETARDAYLGVISGERTAVRLAAAIDFALERPFFNVGQLEAALPDGNFKSAARIVERLMRLGIVEETTGQARHRVFCLREWMERLENLG